MMNNYGKDQGPDPEVQTAIQRLTRIELSPLEEAMFQSWATANQLEEFVEPQDGSGVDIRELYQQSGGKVMPPGQLKSQIEKESAMECLMKAQEAHDAQSPMGLASEAGLDLSQGFGSGMSGLTNPDEQV